MVGAVSRLESATAPAGLRSENAGIRGNLDRNGLGISLSPCYSFLKELILLGRQNRLIGGRSQGKSVYDRLGDDGVILSHMFVPVVREVDGGLHRYGIRLST